MSIFTFVVQALSTTGAHLSVYVTLGATSIIAEEIAPVIAGFAAHQGELHVVEAAVACALGSWLADIGLFEFGRRHAVRLIRRWPALTTPVAGLLRAVRRRPWHAALAVRFAYGARFLLPITCGAARMARRRFVIGSGISAFAWSGVFTCIGWLFGRTAVLMLGHVRHYERRLALSLALAVLIVMLVVQRRNRARVAGEIGGPEPKGS